MNIIAVRRICQGFFLLLFLWFCVVMNLGERWWQLGGWPVNWILQLDPFVGLATLLTTGKLYSGLLWGLATIVPTLFLGRFFCGWVCPFGTVHQITGYLAHRKKPRSVLAGLNRYRKAQSAKYYILIILLSGAAVEIPARFAKASGFGSPLVPVLAVFGIAAVLLRSRQRLKSEAYRFISPLVVCIALWACLGSIFGLGSIPAASLQTGLLDPIPLFHRSVNLILLPLLDGSFHLLAAQPRYTTGAGLIGGLGFALVVLNLFIPRFYCRFICPLGALFGVLGRHALWRIGRQNTDCKACHICETHCEGACEPSKRIRTPECVLCMNCTDQCRHGGVAYRSALEATEQIPDPDISRRGFFVSLISGLAAVPALRVAGLVGPAWNPFLIRPPGALAETEFLHRCVKCGQCMRICPTNVIQPADLSSGFEALWTPMLNFRVGTSGCQLNCIACGHVCPTAAIRPISLSEKTGTGAFAEKGPVRIGTAFVDRGRCLPWAMDIPCIVCQENCPVSPKAITTREQFAKVPTPLLQVAAADSLQVDLGEDLLPSGRYGTGDYHLRVTGQADAAPRLVLTNTPRIVTVSSNRPLDPVPEPGRRVEMLIRLQRPFVDPTKCTGCGVCQHECPVKGKRAIRVTADNETRNRTHALTISL